jgi:hypothetical protein
MKFNILKTRKGKLEEKIKHELLFENPKIETILKAVDDYERDNLETIDKLKKVKLVDTKKINGALKTCINAHGPITKMLIGSATKRIYGALLVSTPLPKKDNIVNRIIKWIRK